MNRFVLRDSLKYFQGEFKLIVSCCLSHNHDAIHAKYDDKKISRAIKKYDYCIFKLLVPFVVDKTILTSFMLKHICMQNIETLKLIKLSIENGADIHFNKEQALKEACKEGLDKVVKILIDSGADVHVDEEEPLFLASMYGNVKTMRLLLKYNINIHARNDSILNIVCINSKDTPQKDWFVVIEILLNNGAIVDKTINRSSNFMKAINKVLNEKMK